MSVGGSRSEVVANVKEFVCLASKLYCSLYYLPIYFEGAKGFSPTKTGVSLIPISASLVPCTIVVGIIIKRIGHFRWAIWLGWIICILSSGLLILLDPDTRTYARVLIFMVAGVGHGLILISFNICTQALAVGFDASQAAVLYTFSRSAGMCIGVSIGGSILQNTLQSHLHAQNLPSTVATSIGHLLDHSRDPAVQKAFEIAVAQSCKSVAEFLVGCAVFACLASFFIKSCSTNKEFKPDHVMRQKQDEQGEKSV